MTRVKVHRILMEVKAWPHVRLAVSFHNSHHRGYVPLPRTPRRG